jgi:hypothetical protein
MPKTPPSNPPRDIPFPAHEELWGCTRIEDGAVFVSGLLVIEGTVWSTPAGLEWMRGRPLKNVAPYAKIHGWTIWPMGPTAARRLPSTRPDATASTPPASASGSPESSATSVSSIRTPERSTRSSSASHPDG